MGDNLDYVFIFIVIVCMTNWIPRLLPGHGPAYLAIADAIANDVRSGRLRPGDRLPPQRLLADLSGLHLSTVTRAYREAERRGLISGHARRGTVVLDRLRAAALYSPADASASGLIDLSTNVPAADPASRALEALLAELIAEHGVESLMRYRSQADWARYQLDSAPWLERCGLDLSQISLVLCAGAQHALDQALALCCERREVAVECFTYPGVKTIAAARGLQLHPLAMDQQGVTPAALLAAIRAGVRVAVISSSLHNPTGISMGAERRAQLAELVRQHQFWLIEEDVYGLLSSERLPPIAALAPQQCLYVTALSKTVAPGLRFGMLALPARLQSRSRDSLHATSWHLSPLCAEMACRMIQDGRAEARLQWQQHELQQRNRWFDQSLGRLEPVLCTAPHRWITLPAGHSATREGVRLRERGLIAVNGVDFAVGAQAERQAALRLSLGAASGRAEIFRAGQIVRETLMLDFS